MLWLEQWAVGAEDSKMVARMLASRISLLPADCIAEIEQFIDFLVDRARGKADEHALANWAMASSTRAFDKVWNNPEDDVYDAL